MRRKCFNLIGQGCISWLLIGCILAFLIQEAKGQDKEIGAYGSNCTVNSDCKLGFVCLLNTCACESSYMYDMRKRICKKICRTASEGLVRHGTSQDQYHFYKLRYTNCSYIDGNLEITFLEKSFDLSFLQHIEEVDGYVLIVNVYSSYLHLNKLRIIRGKNLYEGKYSLYIALNHNPRNESEGIMELQLTSLKEIMDGKVYFYNNNLLCHFNTVRWDDLNPTTSPPFEIVFDSKNYKRPCPACDHSCYNAITGHYHCWGKGPGMCQDLNYIKPICSEACDGRCFGPLPNQCCHSECAAGCHSQKKTDCIACKNFYNEGKCVPFCPKMEEYDTKQMSWVQNPEGRYSFGSLCVQECPSYLLKDQDACVIKCPDDKKANKLTNKCEKCVGPCPKTCQGIPEDDFLNSKNIHRFKGCTIVEGSLKIVRVSFAGDPHSNMSGLSVDDLRNLENIREITGYLLIQQAPDSLRNLSFFSGLEVIHGRFLSSDNALSVLNMQIEFLELTSLRKISNGNVLIALNDLLCFTDPLDFDPLFATPKQKQRVQNNKVISQCEAEGKTCDAQCSEEGCWGPGPDKCILCRNMQIEGENICLSDCKERKGLYHYKDNICRHCHDQCDEGCSGPGPDQCMACKKVIVQGVNGSVCMEQCPESKKIFMYADEKRICRTCDPSCAEGCTGPSSSVKTGGCDTCELAINKTKENGSVHCLPLDQEWCPRGYYIQQFRSTISSHPLMKKHVCQPCDPLCEECDGAGNANCPVCRFYKYGSMCKEKCPQYTFARNKKCVDCHKQCLDCMGPNNTHCVKCKLFKIMINTENNTFSCVEKCPPHLPELAHDPDPDKPTKTVCADLNHPEVRAETTKSKDAERKRLMTIIIPTCIGVLVFGAFLAAFGYYWRQRERAKENAVKLTARMTGVVDAEPLTPTDAKPDLSKLRLIRESELRRGGIIGSGAFGTVYKGFWIPDGENVKIPVAIKVLQEGTSPNQNQELLEEARVMTSVEHPCCIRILAVCMASQMMLITQLMPLGCLLDYVRKHKDNTGSKSLLNWATQIARGMAYLEDRGIVHRDLAARNVLVQSAGQVKITDFGLAKLLDYNEEEYHAAGGKMPIKWLALECIQHRIFTHKSDVWSYGVTVWELFTYGARPYESVRARDVPDLLEKGERLPQPNICTIDVYMIMIKCWMLDAESRPSFTELAEEFAKMARDPGRYLVIQGDSLKKIPSEEIIEGARVDTPGFPTEEGDKLMRLPSYSYDKDDLVRHLSVAGDGPEEVMEADDYLQPAPPLPKSPDNNNIKNPMLVSSGGACNKEPSQLIREKRYGHLESAAAAKQNRELSPSRLRGDSINGRYSSDPVKYTRSKEDPNNDHVLIKVPPPVGNGKIPAYMGGYPGREPERVLQLPLDEDDYLQPKSANPKAYLDLVDGKDYYLNEKQMSQDQDDHHPYIQSPTIAPSVFENPEYFEGDMRQNSVEKPISPVSPSSPVSPVSPISPTGRSSVKPKIAPKPKRLTDYYNDISSDEHRRENRPLLSHSSSDCSNQEPIV